MAITKEVLDELLKGYKGPEDFHGPDGLIKQLSKDLIERAMHAELTGQIGCEKSGAGYGLGLSTQGIREHIKDICNVEISARLVRVYP